MNEKSSVLYEVLAYILVAKIADSIHRNESFTKKNMSGYKARNIISLAQTQTVNMCRVCWPWGTVNSVKSILKK